MINKINNNEEQKNLKDKFEVFNYILCALHRAFRSGQSIFEILKFHLLVAYSNHQLGYSWDL